MMKREEKDLLLKDICARLPYNVKIHIGKTQRIEVFGDVNLRIGAINNTYADVKPYLFPMSSMTEEQEIIYGDLCYQIINATPSEIQNCFDELYDYLNKNHFDYRGLIEKSLAFDATGLNIY